MRGLRHAGGLMLLALLLVPALAAPAQAGDVDLRAEVEKLKSEDATLRSAGYTALSRANDPAAIPLLASAIPEAPDFGQYYGVMLLQRHPKKARPVLRKFLASRSEHLRVLAAAALYRIGERGMGPVIVKALTTEGLDDAKRAMLLMRIYSVRDPAVQEAVRGYLRVDVGSSVVQAAIYDVFLVRDREALSALRGLDAHAHSGVLALAGGCRMLLGDAAGAETVVKAFEAGGVDSSAMFKLKTFLDQSRPVPETVLAALHAALEEETNVSVLRGLIDVLGAHGYAKATKAIRGLLDHSDGNVSKSAFEALTRLPGGVSAETMRKLLEGGDDARRLAAAEALRRADDRSGLPVVISILRTGENYMQRYEAARALANFRTAEAVEPLLEALDDPHSTVRGNAYSSLGTVLRSLFPYRRFDIGSSGYVATGPAAKRKQAVAAMRAWWAKHKDASW